MTNLKEIMSDIKWTTLEQNFLHQRVLNDAQKLDKKDLLVLIEMIHKQSLVNKRMFTALVKHCVREGVELPPIDTLLDS